MKRKDPQFSFASIATQQGRAMLTFDYQRCPLGYTVKLQNFVRDPNSGRNAHVALASDVELTGDGGTVIGQHTVAMNQPLTCGKYTLYQSNSHNADPDKATSVLTVSCDPGRFLKYAGSWMIGGGMLLMLLQRSGLFRRLPCLAQRLGTDAHHTDSQNVEASGASSSSVPSPLGLERHRNLDVDRLIS